MVVCVQSDLKIQKTTDIIETMFFSSQAFLFHSHRNQSELFVWISLRNVPGAKAAGKESLKGSQTENSDFFHLFH